MASLYNDDGDRQKREGAGHTGERDANEKATAYITTWTKGETKKY